MKPVSGGQLTKHKRQLRDNSEDNLRRDKETVLGPGKTISLSVRSQSRPRQFMGNPRLFYSEQQSYSFY